MADNLKSNVHCLATYNYKDCAETVLKAISVWALSREQNSRIENNNGKYSVVMNKAAENYPFTLQKISFAIGFYETQWLFNREKN